ncbi:hypothetical protein [Xylanimonas allomyrinae]|uniref:hypothetical protein n=1 Tax=Xylanimonas allomyrinae TaxID=2509459 RepID=UPI0013A67E8C|nr:hypothetical protein [Xylanimonas allomyrinae]
MDAGFDDDGMSENYHPGRPPSRGVMAPVIPWFRAVLVTVTTVLGGAAAFLVDDAGSRWTLIVSSPLAAAAVLTDVRTRRIPAGSPPHAAPSRWLPASWPRSST